jgi:hypothetical protein
MFWRLVFFFCRHTKSKISDITFCSAPVFVFVVVVVVVVDGVVVLFHPTRHLAPA